jgi:hypothetical protein
MVLLVVSLVALATGVPRARQAPGILEVQAGDFPAGYTPEQILKIQDDLVRLGLDPGPLDGRIGPRTRNGINEFTRLARVDLERTRGFDVLLANLIAAYTGLLNSPHAEDWMEILEDDEFHAWVEEELRRVVIMRRSGTSEQIIEILTEWKALRAAPEPAPEPAPPPPTSAAPAPPPEPEPAPPPKPPSIHDIANFESTPIRWAETSWCGCLQDFGDKIVYGLFPFWMAGDATAMSLDFSVLSRVGYFAVPLDDGGVGVSHSGHWDPESAQFINEARKYDTSIDLVVYNDMWDRWTSPNAGFIDRLATQISDMVTARLPGGFLNRAIPFISLGGDAAPTMGDGVTLYFNVESVRERPAQEQEVIFTNIRSFVGELRRRITADNVERQLSVLVDMDDLTSDDGVFSLKNVSTMSPDIDYLLVFVDEPVGPSTRDLREAVEQSLPTADAERNMLRKMIPFIDPRGPTVKADTANLEDDLVYLEDNFGGVGLLPVPTSADTPVNASLLATFTDVTDTDVLQPATVVCNVVCPNGWWFLFAFEIAILIGLATWVLWLASAEVRIAFDGLWLAVWVWGAVVVLLGLALYLCDSFFRGYRDEIFIMLILGGLVSGWLRRTRKRRELAYP